MIVTSARVRRPVAGPVLAGALLVVGCAVVGIVDPTGGPPVCPFRAVTGLDCPGCGGTRAAHHLFRGNVGAAVDFNILAVLAIPFIFWAMFVWLTKALGGPTWRSIDLPNFWIAPAVLLLIAFWVVRNLNGTPFSWLGTTT
ncbi:MAG: DUF2752 domain-containing protein [Acidimicrobiia bacterium]|nr:DUF2752 domain-containing protein [Acidimicrobiia bacterium]